MNENFKITDSFRLSIEADEARVLEAQTRLVRDSENTLLNKFIQFYGNGVIAEESKADLTRIASETSEGISFDGSISVKATIYDEAGEKLVTVTLPVKANQLDLLSDADLQKLVSDVAAKEATFEMPEMTSTVIEASLSEFSLIDDGSEYLKVYHPSLDSGTYVGVIAKDEYTRTSNKEALLTSILADEIHVTNSENTHELKFIGSFVEPTIKTEAIEEPVVNTTEIVAEEVPVTEEENIFLSHQADSYRQLVESEANVAHVAFEKIASTAANDFVTYLQNLNYQGIRILAVNTAEENQVSITASLFDKVGEKIISVSLPIRDNTYAFPTKESIHKIVAETTDLRTQIASEFEKDTLEHMQAIDELETFNQQVTEAALSDEKIVKTAADAGGMQFVGPVDVLHIDKHTLGLPEDTEVGAKAYVDGYWWQLTSKDHNNLGKEANSGSIWTFTKVLPGKDEPEIKL